METVAIFGVGLIGGSFALALKRAGFSGKIIGVSSPETIDAARRAGAIDDALPLEEAARIADLCYLAQPIRRILDTLAKLSAFVKPDALVTDAGSTKGTIVARATAALSRCQFLGGHPLAGKERRGVESADPELFQGRTYVLTPGDPAELESPAAAGFLGWLRRIGAVPLVTTARMHDDVVAYTSHLPQLTSTALAACVGRDLADGAPAIWGPALLDSTRLALSPFEIWGDILSTNAPAIDQALGRYIAQLQQIREQLTGSGTRDLFDEGARLARRLRDST